MVKQQDAETVAGEPKKMIFTNCSILYETHAILQLKYLITLT